jgi:hypothetical protein
MTQPSKVFVETSIHIDRFWGLSERQALIRANLLNKEVCTSSYVLMEFQRTLIQDLFYAHSLVKTECDDADSKTFLSDLARRLAQRRGRHGQRSVARANYVVALILEEFDQNEIPTSELLVFLLDQIATYRRKFFFADPHRDEGKIACSNETECSLVRSPSEEIDEESFRCLREKAGCRLHDFLASHAEKLEEVRQAFATISTRKGKKQESQTSESLFRILDQPVDWHKAKGQGNCWPLGDTIIALEAPQDAEIYTTDAHYRVICPIVGRSLFKEKPIPPEPLPGIIPPEPPGGVPLDIM